MVRVKAVVENRDGIVVLGSGVVAVVESMMIRSGGASCTEQWWGTVVGTMMELVVIWSSDRGEQ